jgi:hypothetical protein
MLRDTLPITDTNQLSPISTKICQYNDFVAERSEDWARLYEKCGRRPDQSATWTESLIAAHEIQRDDIWMLFGEQANQISWLAPCIKESIGRLPFTVRRLRSIGTVYSLHYQILSCLSEEETAEKLLDSLDQPGLKWDEFLFDKLISDSHFAMNIVQLAKARNCRVDEAQGESPPFLKITGTWDEYLAGKLKKAGSVELTFYEESDDWPAIFDMIEAVEKQSWKREAGTSLRDFERALYIDLVSQSSEGIRPIVTILTLNENPIAYDLSIVARGFGYCLKTSFSAEQSQLSPGIYLRAQLLKRVFQMGIKEYDFLGDSESYKLQWANGVRRDLQIRITNDSKLARLKRDARIFKGKILACIS